MSEFVFEFAARLINTLIGAFLGFRLGAYRLGYHRSVWKIFGLDSEMSLLAWTVAGALFGLLFGKKIWAALDEGIYGRWWR